MTYKVEMLWPTPVYFNKLQSDKNDLDIAKTFKYERMNSDNGNYTLDKNVLDKMPTLKNRIENEFEKYVRDVLHINKNVNFKIINSWINIHKKGDWSQSHLHKNSCFSGVYYLNVPENSGNISFDKTIVLNNLSTSTISYDYDEANYINADKVKFKVEEGLILFFPSTIYHNVDKSNSIEERYSLAFNFFADGLIGKDESVLKIGVL
tara:strand:- start:80 stop:700 length:621 start_codon:yes stop_codon:yes gene_type:complete